MSRIWCSECGTFVAGELVPGISLLDQGHVLSPPHMACEGCERQSTLEPFCLACGGDIEIQKKIRTKHIMDSDGFLPVFVLPQPCPWCGKRLKTWNVGWRDREE